MKTYSREFEAGLKKSICLAMQGKKATRPRRKTKCSDRVAQAAGLVMLLGFLAGGAGVARFDPNQFTDAGVSACIGLLLTFTMFFGVIAMGQSFEFSPKLPPHVFPVAPSRFAVAYIQRVVARFLRCSLSGVLAISAVMMAPMWAVDGTACVGMILLLSAAAIALRLGLFFLQVSIPYIVLPGLAVCVLLFVALMNTQAAFSITIQRFLNDHAGWINLLHPGGWIAEIWRSTVLRANYASIHWIWVPLVFVVGSLFFTLPRALAKLAEGFATDNLWGGPASAPSSAVFLEGDDADPLPERAAAKTTEPVERLILELPSLPEPTGRRWIERAIWKRLSPRERMLGALELKEMPTLTAQFFRGFNVAFVAAVILAVLGCLHRASNDDDWSVAAVCVALAGGLLSASRFLPFGFIRHVNTQLRPIQDHYPVSYHEITKLWFRGETTWLLVGIPASALVLVLFSVAWTAELPIDGFVWLLAFGFPSALYCLRYAALVAGDSTLYHRSFWWFFFYLFALLLGIALIGASIVVPPVAILFILFAKGLLRLRVGAWNRGVSFRDQRGFGTEKFFSGAS